MGFADFATDAGLTSKFPSLTISGPLDSRSIRLKPKRRRLTEHSPEQLVDHSIIHRWVRYILFRKNFPPLFLSQVVEAVMCRCTPKPSSSFQFHDEQYWSVLLSGLKNRQMTITNAFKCISESFL